MNVKKPEYIKQEEWEAVESPELDEVFFSNAIHTHGKTAQEIASEVKIRGKQKHPTKERITIRLSTEVLDSFRATGKGWQTRMDKILCEYVKEHSHH